MSALATPLNKGDFIIAKTPDERQPKAVEQAIDQIPTSQAPAPRKTDQSVESPIPASVVPKAADSKSTPEPSGEATPTPSTPPNSTTKPVDNNHTSNETAPANSTSEPTTHHHTPRKSTPSNTTVNSTSEPTTHHHTPQKSTPSNTTNSASEPSTYHHQSIPPKNGSDNANTESSPSLNSKTPTYKQINFVDIALGVLAPGDFQSQGRYFHFYQFEGRENQLVQIRLTGSYDQRRSNNLSLDPLMFLLDPDKRVLVRRSSAGTANGVRDAFIFVRLPVKGTYTIAVTSRSPRQKGRYSLALRNDRASYTIDESSELSQRSRTLRKNSNPYNVAKFKGRKDQLISIRVDSIFEEFSPYIVLLDSHGKIVASDNDKDGRYSALIDRARLPEDGTYYVVVISAIPQERGNYRLTIF
jgi:hypothetical protein